MAKISARGARALLAIESETETETHGSSTSEHKVRVVLCSDGRILWRMNFVTTYEYAGRYNRGGSYKVLCSLKPGVNPRELTHERLIAIAARRLNASGWREVAAA